MPTKRHGDTHFANIKYGYITIIVSLVYFTGVVLYQKRKALHKPIPLIFHFLLWLTIVITLHSSLFNHEFHEHLGVFIKRLGRISYALVPVNLLLIIKPNVVNYLNLVSLHKLMSRFILVLAILHSIGFIIKWAMDGELFKLFRILNFIGVFMFVPFVILLVVSLRTFMNKNYRLFFWVHQASLVLFIGIIDIHARPHVTFITVLNVVLLIVQIILKYNKVPITINETNIKHFGHLSLITFEKPVNYPISTPGSHLVLTIPSNFRQFYMPSHPFTIINNHENINLIVSTVNRFRVHPAPYVISYPYSSTIDLLQYEKKQVSLFIGGSGISFAISIISYYNNLNKAIKFNLIWCVKDKVDLKILESYNLDCDFFLYVTGTDGLLDDIELQDYEVTEEFKRGRPSLKDIGVTDLLIGCGPEGLIHDAEAYAKTNNIDFIKEYYNY